MIRDTLHTAVARAITAAQTAGDLPAFELPEFIIEHPRQAGMADYAASVAMQLAKVARQAPPKIAAAIVKHVASSDDYTVEVAAGYVNFKLSAAYLNRALADVLAQGAQFGNVDLGHGQKAQVEFGSANPTGYLTIASGRNVIVGDTLANALGAAGYAVQREWYVNDRGAQIARLGGSLFSHYCAVFGVIEPLPEKGYPGDDVVEVAQLIAQREGDRLLKIDPAEARRQIAVMGVDLIMARIKLSLAALGARYDNFFSESSLHISGRAGRMFGELRERGVLIEHDGALWFSEDGSPIRAGQGVKRTDYADDDEPAAGDGEPAGSAIQAVVMRSARISPDPADRATYLFSDVPYLWNKVVERGFNPAVYVWGEDHQVDVQRLYAVARVLGLDPAGIKILIYRFITLMRNGQEARMGKRAGNAVWADDVIDDIGRDAIRYTMLSRTIDTKIVFDLDLLKEQNEKNPVFYVQYGHARIASIFRKAREELGAAVDAGLQAHGPDVQHPAELALLRKILELPEVVALVAQTLQPHHFAHYAYALCSTFSAFYDNCRILKEPDAVLYPRLHLARAAQLALVRVLALMGMAAPDRM